MAGTESTLSITQYLRDLEYPTRREDVLRNAKAHQAPQDVVNQLDRIDDKEYHNENEILEALGMNRREQKGRGASDDRGVNVGMRSGGKLAGRTTETRPGDVRGGPER